jgi:hypothetical protein
MNANLIQTIVWLAAGGVMWMFLKRRRGRRAGL